MRQLILVAHISLDGFAAGVGGTLSGFERGEENLAFVCKLTETADAALFGRHSYELLHSYWPTAKDLPNASINEIAYSQWYNQSRKIIVSKTLQKEGLENTTVISHNVPAQVTAIKEQEGRDILIFGSPATAQLLMQQDLIDCYWIFINPILFGQGIPLFAHLSGSLMLTLLTTKIFPNGEMALQYVRNKR